MRQREIVSAAVPGPILLVVPSQRSLLVSRNRLSAAAEYNVLSPVQEQNERRTIAGDPIQQWHELRGPFGKRSKQAITTDAIFGSSPAHLPAME